MTAKKKDSPAVDSVVADAEKPAVEKTCEVTAAPTE